MQKTAIAAILFMLGTNECWAGDLFSKPEQLCRSFHSEGLSAGNWKASNAFPGEWLCMSNMMPFGPQGSNGMASNIAFYVNGTRPDRADDIRIKVNINNTTQKRQAFNRLTAATERLFEILKEPMPSALTNALKEQTPTKFNTDFGQVELVLEPGRIDSYKVVLTDANFLAAKEAQRNSSADDFKLCKQVVALKAGYPESSLSGDGDPVQESGYKSFFLSGKNNDQFFCEVHPKKHYRIKAAIGGHYPFRYIDEGDFK